MPSPASSSASCAHRAAAGSTSVAVGGALVQAILELAVPESVVALDRSLGFLRYARTRAGAAFHAADAQALPFSSGRFDAVVSGLVLNFVGEPGKMVEEMVR